MDWNELADWAKLAEHLARIGVPKSSDWMDQVPDWAPGADGAITSRHRTVDGIGIVGQLRRKRKVSKQAKHWLQLD